MKHHGSSMPMWSAVWAIIAVISMAGKLHSQVANPDWTEVWINTPPDQTNTSHPNYWMRANRSYTSIAYDKWNDCVYIVNPGTCQSSSLTYKCPKVHIWDAGTGQVRTDIGDPNNRGQLNVDPTIIKGEEGYSFSRGQFPIYRIDLDDEGRIFACNVVSPIWGICFPGPPPNCDLIYQTQGPFRVYRWNNHAAAPKLVYHTLDNTHTTNGSLGNSEMAWTMWGTSFDVVGKTHTMNVSGVPTKVDSVRIFASGGKFYGEDTSNDQVVVFVSDTRANAPYEYRLGVTMQHNEPGSAIAANSIAATGPYAISQLYVDSNIRDVVLENQFQDPNQGLPQTHSMSLNDALSGSITGFSGAIAYYQSTYDQRRFVICGDGLPDYPDDPVPPNSRTRVRMVDATSETEFLWPTGPTPPIGNRQNTNLTGYNNHISDIDYKIWLNDHPDSTGHPHVQVFYLLANNGIASYRTAEPIYIPVELSTFRGNLNGDVIDLTWEVTAEYNNHGFEVLRSFDQGNTWEMIGFVAGRGTTNTFKEYGFTDEVTETHKNLGQTQYRLRQIDTDGKATLSAVVNVYMEAVPTDVTLYQNYPNPFNPSTTITYNMTKPGYVTLKVFNQIGEEVATLVDGQRENGVHYATFDAFDLPAGTYLYQLNVNGTILKKKMVLMR